VISITRPGTDLDGAAQRTQRNAPPPRNRSVPAPRRPMGENMRHALHPHRRRLWRTIAGIALLLLGAACAGPTKHDPSAVADAYYQAGRYGEAAREIDLAVRSHPRDPALRQRAAEMHARAGNLDRAIGHLEVALQLAPDDPTVSVQLGVMEQRRGNLPDAYVAFRRAAQIDPENLEAVSGLALSAEALGFEEEANDAYARWAEIERERGIEN